MCDFGNEDVLKSKNTKYKVDSEFNSTLENQCAETRIEHSIIRPALLRMCVAYSVDLFLNGPSTGGNARLSISGFGSLAGCSSTWIGSVDK